MIDEVEFDSINCSQNSGNKEQSCQSPLKVPGIAPTEKSICFTNRCDKSELKMLIENSFKNQDRRSILFI